MKYIKLILPLISTLLLTHLYGKQQKKQPLPTTQPQLKTHPIHSFDFTKKLQGLSANQIDQHKTLYEGYVKKWNQIEHDLPTVNRKDSAGITYSPFRALKVAETFARNGTLLHELYFENLGKGTKPGPHTKALMEREFGSWDNFINDVTDSAMVARGWVLTCYNLENNSITNYVLEAHNETVPVLSIPLLVIDVYEHAYMIDFGIKRAEYMKVLWNNINWDVVEQRIAKWVWIREKSCHP